MVLFSSTCCLQEFSPQWDRLGPLQQGLWSNHWNFREFPRLIRPQSAAGQSIFLWTVSQNSWVRLFQAAQFEQHRPGFQLLFKTWCSNTEPFNDILFNLYFLVISFSSKKEIKKLIFTILKYNYSKIKEEALVAQTVKSALSIEPRLILGWEMSPEKDDNHSMSSLRRIYEPKGAWKAIYGVPKLIEKKTISFKILWISYRIIMEVPEISLLHNTSCSGLLKKYKSFVRIIVWLQSE